MYSEEFSDYTPTTVDPGIWALVGTVVVCALLYFLSLFLVGWIRHIKSLRRARKDRKRKKKERELQQLQEDISLPEEEIFGESTIVRRDGCKSQSLRGWKEISDSIEEHGLQQKSQLDRNLFQDGEVDDQTQEHPGYVEAPSDNNTSRGFDNMEMEQASDSISEVANEDYCLMADQDRPEEDKTGNFAYMCSLLQMDREMKKLLKLAIPFSFTALTENLFNLLTIASIGRLLGTRELSAYLMVYYSLEITTMFLEGLLSSLTMVCSQAVGADQYMLAGKYVQLAVSIYQLLYIPQIFLWWFNTDDLLIWFGFDEETAEMALSYAKIHVFQRFFESFRHAVIYLLEVYGYAKFVAITGVLQGALQFGAIFAFLMVDRVPYFGAPDLQLIAIIELGLDLIIFNAELQYVNYKGWLLESMSGIFGPLVLFRDWQIVKHFLKTAVPLSFGYILSYGEWEVLLLLASQLGPAETAAWAILGEIWTTLEHLVYAWGDAAEVRCSLLLGQGHSSKAKLSAAKAILLAFIVSGIVSVVLLFTMDFIPSWITNDSTLQQMIRDMLPLVAVGNVAFSVGTVSFQLVGSSGRYGLATVVEVIGSWFITLPLAVLSSMYLRLNLDGLVAAIVIGCTFSGILNFSILRTTNWDRTADKIKRENAKISGEGSLSDDSGTSHNESSLSDESGTFYKEMGTLVESVVEMGLVDQVYTSITRDTDSQEACNEDIETAKNARDTSAQEEAPPIEEQTPELLRNSGLADAFHDDLEHKDSLADDILGQENSEIAFEDSVAMRDTDKECQEDMQSLPASLDVSSEENQECTEIPPEDFDKKKDSDQEQGKSVSTPVEETQGSTEVAPEDSIREDNQKALGKGETPLTDLSHQESAESIIAAKDSHDVLADEKIPPADSNECNEQSSSVSTEARFVIEENKIESSGAPALANSTVVYEPGTKDERTIVKNASTSEDPNPLPSNPSPQDVSTEQASSCDDVTASLGENTQVGVQNTVPDNKNANEIGAAECDEGSYHSSVDADVLRNHEAELSPKECQETGNTQGNEDVVDSGRSDEAFSIGESESDAGGVLLDDEQKSGD